MLLMKERFGAPGARYKVSDILDAVNTVSGRDFTDFFDAHVSGTGGQLDVAATLRKAGITAEQFSDEFYLSRTEDPSPLQEAIYQGITFVPELLTDPP